MLNHNSGRTQGDLSVLPLL